MQRKLMFTFNQSVLKSCKKTAGCYTPVHVALQALSQNLNGVPKA